MEVNQIIHGDCLDVLQQLPTASVDLIFADPPYNLQLKNELYRPNNTKVLGVADRWDKFNSFADYDEFCRTWLRECRRLLKESGSIWVIGSYHNLFRVGNIMQDLGFWLLNDVTWHKTNPMPNFRGRRFTNATETLIWSAKGEHCRHTFNHKLMKRYNGGKQMTSVWSIGLCAGAERLKGGDGKKAHSTQKPEELLKRVILSSSGRDAVVLDPFFGVGTTGAVAKKLGRNFIGIEKEAAYVALAEKRLAAITDLLPEAEWREAAAPRRVSLAELVRERVLLAGETLRGKGEVCATVLPAGDLRCQNQTGSMHRLGALAQGTPTCNGWTFWSVRRADRWVLLDELRAGYRDGQCAVGSEQ
ncbi:methyltransferase [Planctomycetales bacterium]|nr:methyltransferase [Planctomycetales bacterium]